MQNEISVKDAAKIAGVEPITIQRWIGARFIKARRAVNMRLWVDTASLNAYLEQRKAEQNVSNIPPANGFGIQNSRD